jgi:hypothetical protein
VFGGETGEPVEEPTTPDGTTIKQLLDQAAAAFDSADVALRAGDLSGYQRWVDEAKRLLGEARSLVEGAVEAGLGAAG